MNAEIREELTANKNAVKVSLDFDYA